ncbi:MAG: hypothetical protein JKY53_09285 [Flavobacteriales bacterium]|nr:hypothetical protein [Flavobacteriales bacterium]
MDKDFNKWQNNMMDSSSEEPPINMFDSINNELNNDFDQWQSEKFEDNNQVPPDDVWDDIAFGLDSDTNWTVIHNNLRKDRRRYWYKRFAAAALLLLSFGIGYWELKDNSSQYSNGALVTENKESKNNQVKTTITKKNDERNDKESKQQIEKNSSKGSNSKSNQHSVVSSNNNDIGEIQSNAISEDPNQHEVKSSIKHNSNVSNTITDLSAPPPYTSDGKNTIFSEASVVLTQEREDYINENQSLIKMPLLPVVLLTIPSDTNLPFFEKKNVLEESKPLLKGDLYVGVTGAINNTWLISPKTFDGLRRQSSTDSKLSIGTSYGIVVGYNFNAKNTLEMTGVLNENVTQKYSFYSEGKYHDQMVIFNISKLLVSGKRIDGIRSKMDIAYSTSTIYGAYFGKIRQVGTELNGKLLLSSYDYEKYNYGVMLGKETEIFINPSFSVITGIRLNVDVKNIFNGNSMLPADFNATHITSLGFNTSLIYHIK